VTAIDGISKRTELRRKFLAATVAGVGVGAAQRLSAKPAQVDAITLSGPFFNVKDFGAKEDAYPGNPSPTDDTCAINLAIQAALKSYVGTPGGQLRTGGGVVLFPAGRYYVAETIYASRTDYDTSPPPPCTATIPCADCDPVHQGITLTGAGPLATTLVVPSAYSGSTISVAPDGSIDL